MAVRLGGSESSLPLVLTEEQAAKLLSIEPKKLRRLCYEKRGPMSVKIGRERRYPREDLLAWLAARAK